MLCHLIRVERQVEFYVKYASTRDIKNNIKFEYYLCRFRYLFYHLSRKEINKTYVSINRDKCFDIFDKQLIRFENTSP